MSCALQACCKWKIGIGSIPRFLCSEVRACFSRFSWFYTSCASTALHALREVICHCATVPPNSLCCQPLSQRGRRNLTRLWKPPSSLVSLTRFRSSDLRNLWLHPWLVATSLFSFPSGWRHTWWRGRNLSESCGWNGRACMLWPFLNRERPMKGTHWPFSVQEWPEHARSAIPTYSNHNSRHSSWVSRLPPFGPRAWHKPRKVAAFSVLLYNIFQNLRCCNPHPHHKLCNAGSTASTFSPPSLGCEILAAFLAHSGPPGPNSPVSTLYSDFTKQVGKKKLDGWSSHWKLSHCLHCCDEDLQSRLPSELLNLQRMSWEPKRRYLLATMQTMREEILRIPWEGTTTPYRSSDESLQEWRTGPSILEGFDHCLCKELSFLPKFPCHLLFKPQTKCLRLVSDKTVRSYRPRQNEPGHLRRPLTQQPLQRRRVRRVRRWHVAHLDAPRQEWEASQMWNMATSPTSKHEEFADAPADWANRLSKTNSQHATSFGSSKRPRPLGNMMAVISAICRHKAES